jgi:hypothetical protein
MRGDHLRRFMPAPGCHYALLTDVGGEESAAAVGTHPLAYSALPSPFPTAEPPPLRWRCAPAAGFAG